MRICILGNAQSVHASRWALGYSERAHDVHLVSIRSAAIPGVRVHAIHVGPLNSRSAFWTLLSYLRLLLVWRRRLKEIQPDVVHAHYTITHGFIAATSARYPWVLSAWGSDVIFAGRGVMAMIRRILNRVALRRATSVTSTSGFMIPFIRQLAGRRIRVVHVPFGVDALRFTPSSGQEAETFTVGFVKRLEPQYGPEDLIEAAGHLASDVPGLRVVLAGSGSLESRLRERAERLGISENVHFVGRIPHEGVPALMRTFDVFVNPSIVPESFGVAILEASATALPVVATDVGGVPEVAKNGVTAILVPPGRPRELASALRKLAADHDLRSRLGVAGRRFVLRRYRWEDNVTSMLEVLAAAAASA